MTLADVMISERNALMAEYLFPEGAAGIHVPPYAAIPDFDVLARTPSFLRSRHPVRIEELPGKRPGHAFVEICPSLNFSFLWAHVDNDDYRPDYVAFLRKHHGMHIDRLPDSVHVDHLFNRARAKEKALPFVRMVLLPRSINTSHGAGYEKQRTQSPIGSPGRQRGIDEIMLLKLWGVPSPRKGMPLTPEILAHLRRMAVLFGIPVAELERNVRELMEVAAFQPHV